MKRRILFVDDDPYILDGLRRMMHFMHKEWEISFAKNGQEALNILSENSFDVMVSDIRMPGMNGAQLLTEVMKQYPQTVRIVLSGQADHKITLRTANLIHQYLSKPCDSKILKSTLTRVFALRDLLADDKLKQLISQVRSLPSLPSLYTEIMKELQSPNASTEAIGRIISQDVGMTAKILQLVNSAFFGLPRHISNPNQAVTLLGLSTIKTLVLSVHVFSELDRTKLRELSAETLWNHSLVVGRLATQITRAEDSEQEVVSDAFTTGLLHDVGKIVLAVNLPEKYGSVLALAKREKIETSKVEQEIFDTTHAEVGAYLLGLWGLPDPVVEAVAFHHSPRKNLNKSFSPLVAVHVANGLEHEVHPDGRMGAVSTIDHAYLAEINLTERFPLWQKICQEPIQKAEDQ